MIYFIIFLFSFFATKTINKDMRKIDKNKVRGYLEWILSLAKAEDYNLAKEIAEFYKELGIKIDIAFCRNPLIDFKFSYGKENL